MSRPQKATPAPLDVDVVSVIAVGTALWFVAFVVMLPLHGRFDDAGHKGWLWVTLAGWVLGLLGIVVSRAQRAAAQRAHGARDHTSGRNGQDSTG